MRGYVSNAPLRYYGGQVPVSCIERGEQFDEMLIDLADDRCAEYGFRTVELCAHFHLLRGIFYLLSQRKVMAIFSAWKLETAQGRVRIQFRSRALHPNSTASRALDEVTSYFA